MTSLNRREFLDRTKATGLAMAAGVTILADSRSVRGNPANEKVVFGLIGAGGRGPGLAHGFLDRGDCEFAFVADPNTAASTSNAEQFAKRQGGKKPKCVNDLRKALDDKSVNAVIIATPDHWHALATVWACQAGKDVYVEKPACHSCWEGQKMVQAARKYNRIVQVGTQNRSAQYNIDAKKFITDGKLGDIHMCRIYNQKDWGNMNMAEDSDPPQGFNWDIWNGPAPEHRYNPTFRSGWHHFWRYSGGDIANDASHQIDLARWLCGIDYPKTAYSTGGRFASKGAFETPDTQVAIYDCDKMIVTFELTLYTPYMLKTDDEVRRSLTMFPYWPQNATRIELYGTKGLMCVGRHGGGWQVYVRPKDRKPVVKASGNGSHPDPEHKENFVKCLRSRQRPSADIEEGHRTALMIHYANISYRLGGEKLAIDPKTEHIVGNDKAQELFKRTYRKPFEIPEQV